MILVAGRKPSVRGCLAILGGSSARANLNLSLELCTFNERLVWSLLDAKDVLLPCSAIV